MHAAYSLLRTPDFAGLGSLRSLAVLVSSLCMDLCSVGRDDDDLCAEGHPLAVTYLYHRPQKHAAVAEVYRIASESDCNIFAALSPADVAKLRGEPALCLAHAAAGGRPPSRPARGAKRGILSQVEWGRGFSAHPPAAPVPLQSTSGAASSPPATTP